MATKKTRLTVTRRNEAHQALFNHACLERHQALLLAERDLADAVIEASYTPEEHALMARLPDGWLRNYGYIHIRANGWNVSLSRYDRQSVAEAVLVSDTGRSYVRSEERGLPRYTYEATGPLAERIQAHAQALVAWEEKRRQIHATIKSTLAGFKTVEALLEAIPELKELCPDLVEPAAPVTALVPSVERLMCVIADVRGEERNGCCEGKRLADEVEAIAA